ncbi:hypothetical protein BDZ91DRAFT_541504 [Kalaharituber pfeilii]|nr:hypothetical protein BDZ91DRAFT_541504 [Kalaharituber pfeilii]
MGKQKNASGSSGSSKSKDTAKSKDSSSKSSKPSSSKSKSTSSSSDPPKLKPATRIHPRHILTSKLSTMESALARLAAGEAFDAVARELSEDKARQGGSLGWQARGALVPEFEAAAWALPVSSVNKPVYTTTAVKTVHGYHCIMVEGRK